VVLLLAAVLRVGHVFALRCLPLFDGLMLDSRTYDEWAQQIAAGNWLGGDGAFYQDPLYPYVLAVIYRCAGHDLLVVRLFQAALGVVTCWLVWLIGCRVGGRGVGVTAALLLALYRPLIFEGGEIEKTALGVCLVTAALALSMQRPVAAKLGAGACLALAALTRGNLLLLVPLGALYFLLGYGRDARRAGAGAWRERLMGPAGRRTAAFLAGVLLTLFPVLWRNHHVSGEWILTTSQMGTNFYIGNNPSNWSGMFTPVPFVRPTPRYEAADFTAKAEAMTGRRLTAAEVSAFWFRQALEHMVRDPAFAARVCARKFALFWSDLEVQDGWGMYFIEHYSPALRVAPVTFGWLPPLALLGVFALAAWRPWNHEATQRGADPPNGRRPQVLAAWRPWNHEATQRGADPPTRRRPQVLGRHRSACLLVGYVAAYCASLIAFFVFSRYRAHVVPPLAILAALGVRWLWDQVRRREWRHLLLGTLAAAGVGALSFTGAQAVVGVDAGDYVMNYAHLADLYEAKGDFSTAEALLHEGLQRQPEAASMLCGLGVLSLKQDDPQPALGYLARCLKANPDYLDGWFLLGQAHEALGHLEQATWCYRKQLDIQPGHRFAAMCLQQLSSGADSPH
jgi:hypothetical protein